MSSRRAGVLAVMIVLVASPWTLAILMAPVLHNTVYPTTALLGPISSGWRAAGRDDA